MNPRITPVAAGALVLAVVLSACSGPAESVETPRPSASAPAPQASVAPAQTEAPATPSASPACDTIISPGTVQALTDAGWTFEEKEFVIGGVALPEGLLCFWADFTVASDHGQLYGWSAIDAGDAARAQATLLAEGWTREDGPEGVYVTENPQFAMGTDEEGYGMTYLFGDGWVKFADTKQGLILIEWAA